MIENSFFRWSLSSVLGVCVTLVLFYGMQKMIDADTNHIAQDEIYKVIDFVQPQKQESQPEKTKELPPEPKEQKTPPKTEMAMAQEQESVAPQPQMMQFSLPNLGAIGKGEVQRPKLLGPMKVAKLDSELIPMVQMQPAYPKRAKRMGIEGYVKVALQVDEAGEVQDIQIVEASPEGVFEKSVKKALRRWKFRAKTVDGRAVAQKGVLTLTFKLEN